MARRRRSKIGFQPGDEIKIEASKPIDPPWGARGSETKDPSDEPLNSGGEKVKAYFQSLVHQLRLIKILIQPLLLLTCKIALILIQGPRHSKTILRQ